MKLNAISAFVNKKGLFIAATAMLFLASACKSKNTPKRPPETMVSGTIHISVDESFKPVIDSQIRVFESLNAGAHIIVHYKSEADCLRDLNYDSIRMVIITRGLSAEENKIMLDTLEFSPRYDIMAYDAIAVIVNNKTPDSLFTMEDIRSLVKGTSGYKYKVVMDGNNSTSTVRFVVDSLLKGAKMASTVQGAKNSEAVIDYISNNADAIGLIGVSWIGNPDDKDQISFLKNVKIASIECKGCTDGPFVKPYQANIYTGRYPMIRPLYYVLKENYEGLGSGFMNFLILEKGQRIFKRAYLLPSRMSFERQNIDISE
jgi:phosphate transport system substrate-binding protein